MDNSFIALIEESIKKNWELDALTDFKGATLRYKDVARKIEESVRVTRLPFAGVTVPIGWSLSWE